MLQCATMHYMLVKLHSKIALLISRIVTAEKWILFKSFPSIFHKVLDVSCVLTAYDRYYYMLISRYRYRTICFRVKSSPYISSYFVYQTRYIIISRYDCSKIFILQLDIFMFHVSWIIDIIFCILFAHWRNVRGITYYNYNTKNLN